MGIIDKDGNIVIDAIYDEPVMYFDENFKAELNGKVCFFDIKGDRISLDFEKVKTFDIDTGIAEAKLNGKWGLINRQFEWTAEPRWDDTYELSRLDECDLIDLYNHLRDEGYDLPEIEGC